MLTLSRFLTFSGLVLFSFSAMAAEEFSLNIKEHKFAPAEIHVPANQKFKLNITNEDATPEEFESHDLNREKTISAHSKATLFLGPLKPGTYTFSGEFNPKTAQGSIIAK